MRYIFIINGFPRSGKDVFCDILNEISDIPIFTTSWVEKIKLIAPGYGWDGKKDLKGRKLLADLADKKNELCFDFVVDKEKMISLVKDEFIYCIHARRPKDIQRILDFYKRDGYNARSICIERGEVKDKPRSNTADSEIYDFIYDYYIHNDYGGDTWRDEFKENIEIFYNDLTGE